MTVNPKTNAIELSLNEVKRAVVLYLKKLNIDADPETVRFTEDKVSVSRWTNEPIDDHTPLDR